MKTIKPSTDFEIEQARKFKAREEERNITQKVIEQLQNIPDSLYASSGAGITTFVNIKLLNLSIFSESSDIICSVSLSIFSSFCFLDIL